jgi:aspartyl-tRNA(Asn)/glutamyl-tRNA(Gln) amidotransferase subunit A
MLEVGEMLLATHYLRALRARTIIKDAFRRVFTENRLDALITPTEPTTATKIDQSTVLFEDTGEEPFFSVFVRETIPFNLAGLPALSLPCGFSPASGHPHIGPGLPIGLHIAGRPFDESTILRIGYAYQASTDWHRRRPPL